MTLHLAREVCAVVLLDPQELQGALIEIGVPGPERGAREGDHRTAEPKPGPEPAARSHTPQHRKLRGGGAATRVVP